MKNEKTMNQIISWFFLAYFVVLFAERIQSIIRIIANGNMFFKSVYDGYVNIVVILSILCFLILVFAFCKDFWKSLLNKDITPDYSKLTYVSGIILISGMHHTEFTIGTIQFVSYGMLIVAMILKTIISAYRTNEKFKLWYSLIYLIVFSMAIPVMYHSFISISIVFHIIEAVSALALVLMFTLMLRLVFIENAVDLLYTYPMCLMVVFDAVLIAMRWSENINTFLLIFASLSFVLFVIGKVLFKKIYR